MTFHNINIKGIVSCLPKDKELNMSLNMSSEELEKIVNSSGIHERRIVDENTTASDLCVRAAEHLLGEEIKSQIDILIFVTQYPDYILPSTVHLIKERLGLGDHVVAYQLNEGCSGYGYGLSMAATFLQIDQMRNALILVGDTPSKVIGKQQFSTRVLFGDGGTATLLSKGKGQLRIQLGSNGAGFEDIIIKNGLMRYPSGNKELEMSGINVFSFGISKVPKAISSFLSSVQTTPSDFTYIILHQANKMMLERIMKKINFLDSQSLYSLELYGNTGNASIPVTICHNLKGKIDNDIRILCAGFGTGLSWSIFDFVLSPEVFLDLIEYT